MTSRSKYEKVHFKEDGGFDTEEVRDGKSRADTYYTRSKTLLRKAEELNKTTGAHVKVFVLPTWHGGKAKAYVSPNFPELTEVSENVPPTPSTEQIGATGDMAQSFSASPMKERITNTISTQSGNLQPTEKQNMCAICNIVYNSEADFTSHWVQCSHRGCSWWVHCRCICLWYPPTTAGLKALNKWAANKVFCPKHIAKN